MVHTIAEETTWSGMKRKFVGVVQLKKSKGHVTKDLEKGEIG